MRIMRHGLQTVRDIYAIRFAMKQMYYLFILRQQFYLTILTFIKRPNINE